MKKIIAFACLSMITASFAHAADYLFPTTILKQGEVDAILDVSNTKSTGDITNFMGPTANTSMNYTDESVQFRYGLGSHWSISGTMNYVSHGFSETSYASHNYVNNNSGNQNPNLSVKYGFFDDKTNPLSLSGALTVTPKITDNAGSIYSASLSAGWKSNDTLKLYGTVSTSTSSSSQIGSLEDVTIGAYKDISNGITLIPRIGFTKFNASNSNSSYSEYNFSFASHIPISHDTYLVPNLARFQISSENLNNGLATVGAHHGTSISLGLYHLF